MYLLIEEPAGLQMMFNDGLSPNSKFCLILDVLVSALLRDMNMPALSMGRNAYAPTPGHKEPVRKGCAIINVQATAASECVEASDTSTCSTPMTTALNGPHALAAETLKLTCTTKSGTLTWPTVTLK